MTRKERHHLGPQPADPDARGGRDMRPTSRIRNGIRYELRAVASGVYYIHWSRDRRSRRQSTGTKDMAAADAFFDQWLVMLDAPARARALICADLWALKYGMETDRAGAAWTNLQDTFAHRAPCDVTQAVVDQYTADRRAGRIGKTRARPSTIRFEVACLYASWNHAVKRRLLSAVDLPVLDAPPPPSPPRERWLVEAEIDKLFAAASKERRDDPRGTRSENGRGVGSAAADQQGVGVLHGARLTRVERFLWIALDACARRTAIQDLRWDNGQIDFEVGVIHFNPPGRVQTRKKRASVPMSKRLRLVLERAWAERTSDWVLDTPGRINGPLARVVSRSGVAGVTPHVLRHTAATQMARRGVSLWLIAKLLGNTVEQVEKVYAKYAPDMAREAVELIGGAPARPRLVEGE